MLRACCLLLAILFSPSAFAQSDSWAGEWGSYREVQGKDSIKHAEGQRLSITSCSGSICQATVATSVASGDHCDGSGQLQIINGGQAAITIQQAFPGSQPPCVLLLSRNASARTIDIKPKKPAACGDFCTPKCSFVRTFSFRSAQTFYGDDIPGCFLQRSKATMAVCSDEALASLESAWSETASSASSLSGQRLDTVTLRDRAYGKCSSAEDPAACLRALFQTEIDHFKAEKATWQKKIDTPGNPQLAATKMKAILGKYQRTLPNGDVQGRHYLTTDKLSIEPAGAGTIRFQLQTNFFNGHQCSINGTAAYRAIEAFVFQSDEFGEPCVLQIVPGQSGVQFLDSGGSCRAYCGARGSLNTEFSYGDRKSSASGSNH